MVNRFKNKYQHIKRKSLMYHPLYWRFLLNPVTSLKYRLNKPRLNEIQRSALHTLNRDGVVAIPFSELFGDNALFDKLAAFYNAYQQANNDEIEEHRKSRNSNKPYSYTIADKFKILSTSNPMFEIASHHKLFDVVNSYLGMKASLRACDIWQTFVATSGPVRSQNWHRDPEDFRLIKVFIYLNDVDDTAGPFFYAKGSHTKGARFKDPVWFREKNHHNNRSTDEEVDKVVPRSEWFKAVGKAGTIIIADTRGLHKGGFATEKERILFNCMYVSPSSYFKPAFTVTQSSSH